MSNTVVANTQAELQGATLGLGLRIATVTLTDAQIKALPTTPVQILSDPGAGNRNKLLGFSVVIRATSGAYTNIDATYADLHVEIQTGNYAVYPILVKDTPQGIVQLTNALGAAARTVIDVSPFPLVSVQGAAANDQLYVLPNAKTYAGSPPADWDDSTLSIKMDNNGSGDLTGGNAANTLKVTVYYTVEAL